MISSNEITLLLKPSELIDFAPPDIESEIAQNILTIFTTSKYSVPLDREFGLNMALVDMPQTLIKALLSAELTEAIEKYEPRVKIKSISITGGINGQVFPEVKYIIRQ